MTKYMRSRMQAVRSCRHAPQKVVLAAISAVASAYVLRWFAGVLALVLPYDTMAQEYAQRAVHLVGADFWLAAGLAAVGGASSLFHELREDMRRFSLINALGHMVAAQFAGVLAYLIAVDYHWSMPLALVASGIAGWGGNKTIAAVSDAVTKRAVRQIEP